ncbi:hypothetical protein B9Z19DRAFT_1081464 [Tuber borchii]|uniref:Uncharacterized protein n=1 Tax=Tuber borchii TaxID=42251 RepID=A0A2T6ZVK2_TUBBO|nr:hypothetical protein B9Z19DRAFT_1081464 [Tuber borchii]
MYTVLYKNYTLTLLPLTLLALSMAMAITLAVVSFRFMPFSQALMSTMPLSVVALGCGFMMGCFVEGRGGTGERGGE